MWAELRPIPWLEGSGKLPVRWLSLEEWVGPATLMDQQAAVPGVCGGGSPARLRVKRNQGVPSGLRNWLGLRTGASGFCAGCALIRWPGAMVITGDRVPRNLWTQSVSRFKCISQSS